MLDSAKKKAQFWGAAEKTVLLNLLYTTYGITAKQPHGINKELEKRKAPIRVHNGKGTAGSRRHQSFWQLLLLEDYNAIINPQN